MGFFPETVLATVISITFIKKIMNLVEKNSFKQFEKLQVGEILVCNCPVQMGRLFYKVE